MFELREGGDPLDRYLHRLEHALASLPPEERRDIVAETRSHVLDRMAARPGARLQDVLAELGDPATYARRFTGEGDEPGPLRVITALALRGMTAFLALNALVAAYGVGLLLLVIAGGKLMYPDRVGLWVDREEGSALFGFPEDPAGTEVLGWWLVVIGLLGAAGIYSGTTALLRRVLLWRRERKEEAGLTPGAPGR